MVKIEKYSPQMRAQAVGFFLEIYLSPPFSMEWLNNENVTAYFASLENAPDFLAFSCEYNGITAAFCFGRNIDIFRTRKFYINEIFVKKELQNIGIGSDFTKKISSYLKEMQVPIIEISTDKRTNAYSFYKKLNFTESQNIVTMFMPTSPGTTRK